MPRRTHRLFIDTLSLTIPVAAERIRSVGEGMLRTCEQWPDLVIECDPKKTLYRRRYMLSLPDGDGIHVFAEPYRAANRYLKIEYSPNNVGADGAQALTRYLRSILGSSFRDDFYSGHVNRFHVGFDIHRVPLERLLVTHYRQAKSAIVRGTTCRVETLMFSYGGDHELVVYDKGQQQRDKGRGGSETSVPWVRFEFRYDKGSHYRLGGIWARLRNPFNQFMVRRFEADTPGLDNLSAQLLFDACRLEGIENVLRRCDSVTRERYEVIYNSFPVAQFWTRRTSIWMQLKERVETLLVAEEE